MKIERRGFTGFALSIKDFLQGQRLSNKGDSQTTPQPPNQGLHVGHTASRDVGSSTQRLAPAPSPSALDFL